MSSENAQNTTLAGIYAEAITPLAQQAGGDEFLAQMLEVLELLEADTELSQWLDNPLIDKRVRSEAARKAFKAGGASETVCDTLAVLARRSRLGLLGEIVEKLERNLLTAKGVVCVEVHTAGEIDAEMAEQIHTTLTSSYGCEVKMDLRVDKSLLGGLVIKNGDDVTDMSLRRDFESMVDRMKQR